MIPKKKKDAMFVVMQMTQTMLDLAKSADWEGLVEIEANRQKLLLSSIDQDVHQDPDIRLGEKIQSILAIDKEIQAMVKKAKDAVRDELIQINRGKNQTQAYQFHP